eukprot:15066995-Heterocapsa_arctica.AAC.1
MRSRSCASSCARPQTRRAQVIKEVMKEVIQEVLKEPAELQGLQQLTIRDCKYLAALPAEMGQLQALRQLTSLNS